MAGGRPFQHLFRWLRENDPVHWHEEPNGGRGFWAITKYEDVREVTRDAETFSNYKGGIHIPDTTDENLAGARNMMLFMDPPEHTRYRNTVKKEFTPRQAARLTQRIQELASQIVDEVIERGECDLVTDIAGELPSYVIAELMGIPLEDGRKLYEWTEIMHSTDHSIPYEERAQALPNMLNYARSVAKEKQGAPGNDLATAILEAELDGEQLSDAEFDWFFLLLINAGGDTTRNLVAGGMEVLFKRPDERERLRQNLDELLPTATEEMLRFCSPVAYMRRTATRDTELHGKRIREGDKLALFYGSANRDEEQFPDPDTFDVGRTPNEHVAFGGGGPHYCLGAHVARIEIQAILRELLTRVPDMEPAGDVERLPSVFIAGPRHLPVRFTPGKRHGIGAAPGTSG
ncbi:MAG: cytochrome P450 [Dehalococcoidia bacterium]|nr:cytochrome P450 [Dehalococcoidia bacterium]